MEGGRRHPHAGRGQPRVRPSVRNLADRDVGFDDDVGEIGEPRRQPAAAAGNLENGFRMAERFQEAADQPALAARDAELEWLAPELLVVVRRVRDVLELGLVGGTLLGRLWQAPRFRRAGDREPRDAVLDRVACIAAFAADPVRADAERGAAERAGEKRGDVGNAVQLSPTATAGWETGLRDSSQAQSASHCCNSGCTRAGFRSCRPRPCSPA